MSYKNFDGIWAMNKYIKFTKFEFTEKRYAPWGCIEITDDEVQLT